MKDENKTKKQLIDELKELRQRVKDLETQEIAAKPAEGVLRESEKRYRILVENANEAIIVAQDGVLKFVNIKSVEFFGYSKEELTSKPFAHFIYPEDREAVLDNHSRRLKGEKFLSVYPFRVVYKDGSIRWMEINVALIEWEGRPASLNFLSDITERKMAEEELGESEMRYRHLVEGSPDIVWSFSDRRGTLYVSSRVESILGYSPDYLYRNPWLWNESIHPNDRDHVAQAIRDFAAGKELSVEYQIKDSSGNWRWFHDRSIDRHVKDDETIIEGISRDITEKKRTEEALRRSEENFRRSLDDSSLGVRIVSEEGETIYANRPILDIYGYDSIEELRTTPVKKRYSPESYAEFKIRRDKRERGEYVPPEYEISVVKKNGEVRHLQVFRKEVLWDGEKQYQVIYHDITERKRAEDALRESEAELATIFDGAPVLMLVVDRDYRVRKASRTAQAMVGATELELRDVPCGDVLRCLHRLDSQGGCCHGPACETCALRRAVQNTLETGLGVSGVEVDFETEPKGELRKCSFSLSTSLLQIGGEAMVLVCLQDITERKQIIESLQKSQATYKELVENLNDIIFSLSNDGLITYMSPVIKEIFGYSPTEVIGHSISEFVYHEDLKLVTKRLGDVLQNCLYSSEYRVLKKTGEICWVRTSSRPMYESGRTIGIQGVMTDITDRKKAEEALQKNLTLYRGLIETTDTGFVILDQHGKVLDANQGYVHLSGHEDLSQIRGRSVVEWTADYEKERNAEAVGKCFREGQIRNFEIGYVNAQGKITPIEINATVVKVDDVPQILTLCRDITERKQAEEEKRRLEERSRKVVEDIFRFIPEGVLVFSRKMELLRQNQAFRELVSGYAKRLGFAEDELENLIIDKIKAGMGDKKIKEIRISRKHETWK